jgi:tetratricopeptide (TPR) repeat protein
MSADLRKIQLLISRGRFKEAENMIREQLAKEPDEVDLHIGLSHVQRLQDRPKEAEESARRAIGLDPESGYPHELLAQALIDSSRWTEAEEALRQAMALDGEDPDCQGLLAKIYHERDKPAEALAHAEAGLAIDPDHELCRLFRGVSLGKLGRHEEADETAMSLLSDDPEDSYNHSARGWILMERGAAAEAKMHFQEALRCNPENEDARLGLARALQTQHPVLGWLLRLIIRAGKIKWGTLIVVAGIVFIVLPRYLQGSGVPFILVLLGQVLRVGMALFFYISLATRPLFDSLLALSRDGRLALSTREKKAVAWCVLPLLAGLYYTGVWLAGGARNIPFQGISLICAAALIHQAVTMSHPWIKRRMAALAVVATALGIWTVVGPRFALKAPLDRLVAEIKALPEEIRKSNDNSKVPPGLLKASEDLLRVRNWAFMYPVLLIYLLTAFSDEIATALRRRAPDESE